MEEAGYGAGRWREGSGFSTSKRRRVGFLFCWGWVLNASGCGEVVSSEEADLAVCLKQCFKTPHESGNGEACRE